MLIQENAFESVVCETAAILSRPQCVNVAPVMAGTYTTNGNSLILQTWCNRDKPSNLQQTASFNTTSNLDIVQSTLTTSMPGKCECNIHELQQITDSLGRQTEGQRDTKIDRKPQRDKIRTKNNHRNTYFSLDTNHNDQSSYSIREGCET